jgi:hypothetical protein
MSKLAIKTIIFIVLLLLFSVTDVVLYTKAPYPERTRNVLYKFPGGGFAAYFLVEKDK